MKKLPSQHELLNLQLLQRKLRLTLLDMYYKVKAGHIGCSLSCIDLMIAGNLFFKDDADSFILSKGHAAAALYACLYESGEISTAQLESYYKDGTCLPAHPAANKFKGIPFALGSLGHGMPIAAGIAKANKLLNNGLMSFVLMSDGETNEGTTWEAAHFAARHQLDNLIVLIDNNNLQGFGNLNDVLGNTAAPEKWNAMGFETLETDGHDLEQIVMALSKLTSSKNGKPKVIIAHTVKGKGVSYMEHKLEWHYLPMDETLYNKAKEDIKRQYHA